ncbi:MAG: hypothetical protein K2J78_05050 [Muribaculaceae bacterium]|nr:hypothetical protein [Muribaculaceae bacterium]
MTTSYKRITESIEDLLGKSHYLVAKSQMDGNLTFDGHAKTVEELDNESRCRSLCTRIERALETCREEEIPELLEMYDLLYRIGYGKVPSPNFLTTQRNRVYTAWRSGNRNIQESQIYRLLKKSTNGHALHTKMLRHWLRILIKHNRFPNVTTHENYQRLSLVMRENISKDLKLEWYRANKVDDSATLSAPLLKSYRNFIHSLFL